MADINIITTNAIKRQLYQKTQQSPIPQLIASSADIVYFDNHSAQLEGNPSTAQAALEKIALLANNGGSSVQAIISGDTKAGHAVKADKVVNKLTFTAYKTASSTSSETLEYDGSTSVTFDRVAKAQQAICDGNNNIIANTYIPQTAKGISYGVATLDGSGKVPTAQLPSYVDDVLEYENRSKFPQTGESGKIYVAQDTNITFRWSGSTYVEISKSLAIGETSSTAYAGDKGKKNADDIADIIDGTKPVGKVANKLTIRIASAGSDTTEDVEFDGSAPIAIGTHSGNMVYAAKRAQQDGNGNNIITTYATKAALTDGTITVKKAEKLSASKEISLTGDVTGSVDTDFSGATSIETTLANTGVTEGTYSAVYVDVKGRVTAGSQVVEFGEDSQGSPTANLAIGGLFFKKL